MTAIWMAYFASALAASGVFIVAGRRTTQAKRLVAAQGRGGWLDDPLWGEMDSDFSESSPHADARGAMRLALKRLAPVMASQSVQAEVAVPFGLQVRMRGGDLADLLEEMLASAIHAAPASRILLVAAEHGDQVSFSVTDDMPGADAELRKAGLRNLMARVALGGGTLAVEVQPTEGTMMTLRLAAVDASSRAATGQSARVPAAFS